MVRHSRSQQALPASAARYTYPEHLRQALRDMPTKPGVYTFHAAHDTLPLYIGKSINLRARLLSHLRNPQEARMLRQTTHISHIRTAGEIGALLLEAQMIKQQQPLFNQKLRRNKQLCAFELEDGVPRVVSSQAINFAQQPNLYGLYSSPSAAQAALRSLADQHKLCYGALGLEKLAAGRPCFRAMLKQCGGVCCGRESPQTHHTRLMAALEQLKVSTWPYPGAIGLKEDSGDMQQIHVVHNWCYLGSAPTLAPARKLAKVAAGFDADGYKILCKPILTEAVPIVML